jgi:UDP-glucose 4-epimerase
MKKKVIISNLERNEAPSTDYLPHTLNMNILITGATGFIGSNICKELINTGYNVFGLSYSGRTQNISSLSNCERFHLIKGDIRERETICHILESNNIKTVLHLASYIPQIDSLSDSSLCFDINVKGTLNVLRAAYLNSVSKFIFSSSMSVYSQPPKYLPVDEEHPTQPSTYYGKSKFWGELCCNLYSKVMNIIILRYSGVYGKGQEKYRAIPTFINQALSNEPITIHGDGTQTSDFVYVKDVIQATLQALNKNRSGIFNIGSGEEVSIKKLAKKIIVLCNSKTEITIENKNSERPFRFAYDISKAKKVLGYSPHPLEEGLSEYIRCFK